MKRHWIKKALAFIMLAALAASVAAVAEPGEALPPGFADVEEQYNEIEVTLDAPDGAANDVPVADALTLAAEKVTLGEGETFKLSPSGAHSGRLAFKSSDTYVATVSKKGKVTARKAGKATITALLDGEPAATCRVTVKKAPRKMSLDAKRATLEEGDTLRLKAILPEGTASNGFTWLTSSHGVATVDKDGVVTAVAAGAVTITVKTYNGKMASCKVTVKPKRNYRALLVGNVHFSDDNTLIACGYDVKHMAAMLHTVKGPTGGFFAITRRIDVSKAELFAAIKEAFAGATENDVSLFYYSGHGDDTDYMAEYPDHPEYIRYAGALPMVPLDKDNCVELWELADALKAVPGKVIILIDTCGSGAGVYVPGEEQNGLSKKALRKARKQAARDFDHAVIDAFAAADTGVMVKVEGESAGQGDDTNLGEYRVVNKFYVLTAARYAEPSWCWQTDDDGSGDFTGWLIGGVVGENGDMPADVMGNGNGVIELKELFKYISCVGDNCEIWHYDADGNLQSAYQHVQVYPKGSGFGLFRR